MKATATILSLLALSTISLADPVDVQAAPTTEQQVRYGFGLTRGFIQGYEKGMYKRTNYKVQNACLDSV